MLMGLAKTPGLNLVRLEAFLEIAEILALVDNFPNNKEIWKNNKAWSGVKKTEKSQMYIDLLTSSFRMFYGEVIDCGEISTNDWNEWFFDYGKRESDIKRRISTLAQRVSIKDDVGNIGQKMQEELNSPFFKNIWG